MRRIRFYVLFTCMLSCAALGGDAAAVRDQVWNAYLSPAEQAALAGMPQAEPEQPQPGQTEAPSETDHAAMLAAARDGFAAMAAEMAPPVAGMERVPFREDGVAGLWFRPEGADRVRVLLYFHGGGYMVGNAATASSIAGFLAREAGITAFSLEYPLAPESPFPAQLDSALAGYRMLLARGIRPEHIVIAGDSAGGNLTLATLIRLRDMGMPLPVAAYVISPWADGTHTAATHALKADIDTTLTLEMLEMMAAASFGERDRRDPLISPVFADLRGLPPLLVQAGSFETLLDDSLTLVRNAGLADVPVWLSVWPGYTHDFQMFHSRLEGGRRALAEAADFLRRALDGTLLRD